MGSGTIAETVAESAVSKIIKSLSLLDDDLDSMSGKLGDMKKQIAAKTQGEIESLMGKTKEMATKEAEVIISESRERAVTESKKITDEGEARLAAIKSTVEKNFDDAVEDVVSMILRPS